MIFAILIIGSASFGFTIYGDVCDSLCERESMQLNMRIAFLFAALFYVCRVYSATASGADRGYRCDGGGCGGEGVSDGNSHATS